MGGFTAKEFARRLQMVNDAMGVSIKRFNEWASNLDERSRAGEFGKWPWQKDYALWPWQRRRKR